MNYFKAFSKKKVDDEILSLFQSLQCKVNETYSNFEELWIENQVPYLTENQKRRTQGHNSIGRVFTLMKRINSEFKDCYAIRSRKKHYDFTTQKGQLEKESIKSKIGSLIDIVDSIENNVDKIQKHRCYADAKMFDLEEDIIHTLKDNNLLEELPKEYANSMREFMKQILADGEDNKKKGLWLNRHDLRDNPPKYSVRFPIHQLRFLELLPIINVQGLKDRHYYIFDLHKDKHFPVFHYNLVFQGKSKGNIHVVPSCLKDNLHPYIEKYARRSKKNK